MDRVDLQELSAAGGLVAYFGYGSLVNRATLRTAYLDVVPATLLNHRRQWRPRPDLPGFPSALLTIQREPGASCDGLLVFDRVENLAAVDVREAVYVRSHVDRAELTLAAPLPDNCPVYVYARDPARPPHSEPPRILHSYLDAVMQGFFNVYGEAGLRRFVAETEWFSTPVHADRHDPIYPRHVSLSTQEAELFDRLIAERDEFGPARPLP